MKDKENNMTKQTLTKTGKALSDRDLDLVSGGRIDPNSNIVSHIANFVHCNYCDYELGEFWEGEYSPVKDGMPCSNCHRRIILSKCRIEQRKVLG